MGRKDLQAFKNGLAQGFNVAKFNLSSFKITFCQVIMMIAHNYRGNINQSKGLAHTLAPSFLNAPNYIQHYSM